MSEKKHRSHKHKHKKRHDDNDEEADSASLPRANIYDDDSPTTGDKDDSSHPAFDPDDQHVHPPSFFTNERGNLKVVATIAAHPCLVFNLIIALCLIMSFLLNVMVFRTAEGGNPFTVPGNEFDLNDVRSIQYDSFRLAAEEVNAAKKFGSDQEQTAPKQSENAAIAMWVFEGTTDSGVFGSRESIQGMKDAYDIFANDPEYQDYCLLDYRTPLEGNETERKCQNPTTPLTMYYPSEWDGDKAAAVIEQLKDPEKVELFNSLALCSIQGLFCDSLSEASARDALWALALHANVTAITKTWDMQGELVQDFRQVTTLASYLMQVDLYKGFVDFGFDKGFNPSNPVSK